MRTCSVTRLVQKTCLTIPRSRFRPPPCHWDGSQGASERTEAPLSAPQTPPSVLKTP